MAMAIMRFFTTLHARIVAATGWLGGGTEDGSVLVLHHVGAKSGRRRTTPLLFLNHGDGYAVVASMGGAPTNPGWYHNLLVNPEVTVTVDRTAHRVRARELTGEERAAVWARLTERDRRWERYASRTERVIPILALERI